MWRRSYRGSSLGRSTLEDVTSPAGILRARCERVVADDSLCSGDSDRASLEEPTCRVQSAHRLVCAPPECGVPPEGRRLLLASVGRHQCRAAGSRCWVDEPDAGQCTRLTAHAEREGRWNPQPVMLISDVQACLRRAGEQASVWPQRSSTDGTRACESRALIRRGYCHLAGAVLGRGEELA